ncbi:hypothetical protein CR970_00820 [Candidatus Saccharibacteria bacterium]|nr:MAG: hypothetical protein CR970_00820 [Candidatus Saccharibacteria bacterium]
MRERQWRAQFTDALKEQGLTMNGWLLLGVVSRSKRQAERMAVVAATLGVSLPQLHAIASKLDEGRYIRIKADRRDKRSKVIVLSSRGAKALRSVESLLRLRLG